MVRECARLALAVAAAALLGHCGMAGSRAPATPAGDASPASETSPAADTSPAGEVEAGAADAGTSRAVEATLGSATALRGAAGLIKGMPSLVDGGQAAAVKAGSHDDNEEYLLWLDFLDEHRDLTTILRANYRDRVIVRVVDRAGRPMMNEAFTVRDDQGRPLWQGRTYASGEAVIFPRAFLADGSQPAQVTLDGRGGLGVAWAPSLEGIVTAEVPAERPAIRRVPVDIAFILDATGSMGDEIQQLQDVLFSIHARLQGAARLQSATDAADLRFGLVVYRDRNDEEPLRVVPFTADVDSFHLALAAIRATGGGDTPEDVHRGLEAALTRLAWRPDGIRNAFLVADAPPHVDYGQERDYLWAGCEANSRAIRIHMIGASGLGLDGEYIFREIAATTGGQFIFLTYGETGESEGGDTPSDPGKASHHTGANWSARRLDDIVVDLVRRDLAYQTGVPILATDNPPPAEQEEYLATRVRNLWEQVARQLAARGQDTVTAVLLPFEDALADTGGLAEYLRDLSTETLVASTRLRLVERDRLAAVLAEQHLAVSGLADADRAVDLGRLLNSRLVLSGRLYRLGMDRVVHVRAVDVETARIVAAARVRI